MPLPGGAAVAVVTRRERAATLPCGAPLWRATCAARLDPPSDAAAPPDAARERYADLLRLALAEPGLYYSDEADATRCEQDRHGNGASSSDDKAGALSVRASNAQHTVRLAA